MPTGVLVADMSGRPSLVNQALRRLLHWPEREDLPLPAAVPLAGADGAPVPAADRPPARALFGLVEGVETEEQAAYLRAHGCDSAQGYLYARPARWSDLTGAAGPPAALAA